jgi:transcriptional regulator with XRE-family HTH domain
MGTVTRLPSVNMKPNPGVTVAHMTTPAVDKLKTFGARLKFARANMRLTQAEFAKSVSHISQSKCSKSLVSRWESDEVKNPQNATLLAISAITGFAQQWLVLGTGPQRAKLPDLRVSSRNTEARLMLRRAVMIAHSVQHANAEALASATIEVYETLLDEPSAPDGALRRIARQSKTKS